MLSYFSSIKKALDDLDWIHGIITVAPSPDGELVTIPSVLKGAVKSPEDAKLIGIWLDDLMMRLSIEYQISTGGGSGIISPTGQLDEEVSLKEIRMRLSAMLETLASDYNAEIAARAKAKARDWKFRWEVLSNAIFLERWGQQEWIKGHAMLGGWELAIPTDTSKNSTQADRHWTTKQTHYALCRSIYFHMEISKDGKRARMFLVPLGWTHEAKNMIGWFIEDDGKFWSELEKSAWEDPKDTLEPNDLLEHFHQLLKVYGKAKGTKRFFNAPFTAEQLCRYFPYWAPAVEERIDALGRPSLDSDLIGTSTLPQANGPTLIISKIMSYQY